MTNVKAIIFDLGNVIINISFERVLKKWSKITGLPIESIIHNFQFDDEYKLFEKGQISIEKYIKHVSMLLQYQFDYDTFKLGWNDIFIGVSDNITTVLKKLHKKYRLIALTNTNILHTQEWKVRKYESVLKYFDSVFCSHEIGYRKPEKEAFNFVLKNIKENPKDIIFIDDDEENIYSAKLLGIKSILAKSTEEIIKDLKHYGIQIGGR